MKSIPFLVLFIFCFKAYPQTTIHRTQNTLSSKSHKTKTVDYLPNTVIIKFKAIVQDSLKTTSDTASLTPFQSKSFKIISLKKKFPANWSTEIGDTEKMLNRIYELKYSGNIAITEVIQQLLQNKNIEYAEPSYTQHLCYIPNDPNYPSQDYLNQVKVPQAWNMIKNSSNVTIAIVDGGSDLNHEDLAANINPNQNDPVNGIDDDHDGYIDNYKGWDFVGASANNIKEDNDPSVKSNTTDHGVHVSGLASAVSDNGIGVSSIAFNAKLLIVKVTPDDDGTTIYKGYEGIKYAVDHGAQIINCSWGSASEGLFGQDVINYAISKGCLVVAAAGNNNSSVPQYPAAYNGVMAVANVTSTDAKNPSSNFGSYVNICAPGTNILSTLFNNTYGIQSGTSMACPIVASAAALVKAYFPNLNMQQVEQKLRVTADNIDDKNPALIGQLGAGRLNVYKALTQSSPAIKNQKITIHDIADGTLPAGDTAMLYFDVKNFLDPAINLLVRLSSASNLVTVLTPPINIGNILTLETKTLIGPFKVYIKPSATSNSVITFRLDYNSSINNYNNFEYFTLPVNCDFINIQINNISTTLTSTGRIGYNNANGTNGLGFQFKGHELLYEASLIIGNSPLLVSNNARNDKNGNDEDFVKQVAATRVNNSTYTFEGKSEFDDSASPNPLHIYIKHRQIALTNAPDDKYSIAEYEFINTGTSTLSNVYLGLFTDWDIDKRFGDATRYDPVNRLAYVFGKSTGSLFAGVKLLSTNAPQAYYPLSIQIPGNLLATGFNRAAKYKTLSSGVAALSLGDDTDNGYDVAFVSGYGPYNIPVNGSVKVAFAFVAGESLADISNTALSAQNQYTQISPDSGPDALVELKQNYPNPAKNSTAIAFNLPMQGNTKLNVYNLSGQLIKTLVNDNLQAGKYTINLNTDNIMPGIYVYKLQFNSVQKALKMIIGQ
jgi:serine protease